ncbi:5217_t:CDS:1, partial [Paraglomus brasilianum]
IPTQEFDSREFRKLFYSAKSHKELFHAKRYLCSYFARGDIGVYKWMPKKQFFKYYSKKDACDSFIQSDCVQFKNAKGEEIESFSITSWFFRDTPFFSLEVNPAQPKIYREPNGAYYINLFQGFLHPNPPPFQEFSKEIRDQVKLVLNHMREVLCSSVKKQELYMMGLIMRIAIGQKMQKTMFLFSGPGTGKTMLTWFLRHMVLGPNITVKTANERVITGQFNKELEGKVLLILEEMSNSKSTDWITFANRLKDFIDSDTLMIEEKYRTPYPVTNITNLIINSNNSKTIRLDRADRRYFIPDISDKYVENGIGMDHYYAPLDKAIKNPEVGKAFYSYALEYVKLNPDFNERKIPMTKTKLMMVTRDYNVVHEFIKQKYVCKSFSLDESSSYLYNTFKDWFIIQSHTQGKKPPTMQEFSYALKELGLKPKPKRIGDRKNNKRAQWYEASYESLYTIFWKKNMIDEDENIDEPDNYQEAKLQVSNSSADNPEILPAEEEAEPHSSLETNIPKKVPPPIPPKPANLRVKNKEISEKITSQDAEHHASGINGIEPCGIPGPSNSKIIYKDDYFEDMYKRAKSIWESCSNDPEDFEWECFICEIEDLSNHDCYDYKKDPWHYRLRMFIQAFRGQLNGLSNQEIASKIAEYLNKRGQIIVSPPENYKTVSVKNLRDEALINIKECELAEDEDFSEPDEEWENELKNSL